MYQPYLHQAVQSLQTLSSDELRDLLGDDEKLDERVNEAVQSLESSKDLIIAENRSLAETNLNFEPKMVELRSRVQELAEECRTLGESVKEKAAQLASKSEKNNAETVLALLQTAAAESEEESENIVKQLLDGEISIDAYVEQFTSIRKLMHSRKLQAEKMTELIRSNRHTTQRIDAGYGPASMPYPSTDSARPGSFYTPPGMMGPSTAVPYPYVKMSSKRGDTRRSRPQKHQNTFAFKNNLHDKHTPLIKLITNLNVCEVCEHCKSVIDWKIKYRKYKPLTQPKSCSKCGERKVKRAYHVICRDCALTSRCCAKCLKSADEASIIPPEPTEQEQIKLKAEMDQLIKSLPERKRRTFLRYMNRGRKQKKRGTGGASVADSDEEENDGRQRKGNVGFEMPRTREELLEKFEQLKLAAGKQGEEEQDDDDSDDFSSDDEDYEDYSEEELSKSSDTK
uniref:VPS37 C-terminal domain-containing protein n=1 Tax=Anopheles epiroticus TaxID=199890 RepID=A0A182PKG0_9DIPT